MKLSPRLRFGAVSLCLVCSVAFIVYLVAQSKSQYNWDNVKYVEFGGFDPWTHAYEFTAVAQENEDLPPPNAEWRSRQMKRWQRAIQKAAALLPARFLKAIGPIEVRFYADQSVWETAHPRRDFATGESLLFVNLKPSENEKPEWMTWEPFPCGGFEESEMIWITIHEMKHLYDSSELGFETWNKAVFEEGFLEESSTIYGRIMGEIENSADSFALYVLWPDYLKPMPKRYDHDMKLLGREYRPFMDMPNSVRSKLTTAIPEIAHRPIGCSS